MSVDLGAWRRVIKLDPGRRVSEERLREVVKWSPDAIVVGGSGGYGLAEVVGLFERLRPAAIPLALEIADADSLCPGFDLYLVPMVLNSSDADWVIGHHQAAVKRFAHLAEWDKLLVEGYCILNAAAAAADLSRARAGLDVEDVVAYALLAEHLLRLPIFYLEYSGRFGDRKVVEAVARVLSRTRLWYGGGIREAGQLGEMAGLVDTVVLGNVVYDAGAPLPEWRG